MEKIARTGKQLDVNGFYSFVGARNKEGSTNTG